MLRVPPAYYRSRDPIHNLKIKVSIRKTHQKRSTKAKVVGRGDDDEERLYARARQTVLVISTAVEVSANSV